MPVLGCLRTLRTHKSILTLKMQGPDISKQTLFEVLGLVNILQYLKSEKSWALDYNLPCWDKGTVSINVITFDVISFAPDKPLHNISLRAWRKRWQKHKFPFYYIGEPVCPFEITGATSVDYLPIRVDENDHFGAKIKVSNSKKIGIRFHIVSTLISGKFYLRRVVFHVYLF